MNNDAPTTRRRPRWIPAILTALLAAGCFREVERSFNIRVPQMQSEAAAAKVRSIVESFETNLLRSVEIDLPNRTVTITYHSERVARRNFERALSLAGFDANDLKADPTARATLPQEMR